LFVFALFNLQGTYALRSAVSLIILAHHTNLVKKFFLFFTNFFFVFSFSEKQNFWGLFRAPKKH